MVLDWDVPKAKLISFQKHKSTRWRGNKQITELVGIKHKHRAKTDTHQVHNAKQNRHIHWEYKDNLMDPKTQHLRGDDQDQVQAGVAEPKRKLEHRLVGKIL